MKIQYALLASAVLAGLNAHAHALNTTSIETSLNSTVNIATATSAVETISITGSRSPIPKPLVAGSVSIIDSAQIKASGALNIAELLRTVAGTNISQTGPSGSLVELRFRGSESNHILVLVDGMPINDLGQGGLVDFSHLMLSQIDRIEILRGPQSAIWGSSAIAGIISVTTKQATTSEFSPTFGLSIGDRDTYQTSLNLSQQKDQLRYSLNASYYETAGENISREGDESDGYTNTTLSSNIAYTFSANNTLQVNARYVDYDSDFDATNFATGFIADADNNALGEQISVGLNWQFRPIRLANNSQENSLYSQLLSLQYTQQSTDNYVADVFSGGTEGQTIRALWNNRFDLATDTFINIGFEGIQEDYKQSGPITFGDPNQSQSNNTYSVVSSAQWALTRALNFSASLRYDNNDEFNNTQSYRVGAVYIISPDLRIFASTGKAIKNPTFTERFGFFPQTFLGNPNLTPETQTSLEAGIELDLQLAKHDMNLQLSWFDADLQDEILGFVFNPESAQFTAQNANGQSKRRGIELSIKGSQNALSWQAQYSYLDADETSNSVDVAPELRRAKHTGSANVAYSFKQKHTVYMQADYTGSRLDRFFPPFPQTPQVQGLDAYWLLSINYAYQVNSALALNLRMTNMLNREFEDVIGFSGESSRVLLNMRYAW
jgi:vitamin B12 transporter